MVTTKIFYERNLPHYQPPGYAFFVTFRLANSLPTKTIIELKKERAKELEQIASIQSKNEKKERYKKYISDYFGKFDKLLDGSATGPKWLSEPEVSKVVQDSIHFRDGKEYDLIAYTIMPNHVHLVIKPILDKLVDRSAASIKTAEAETNRVMRSSASHYILTKILQDLKSKTALKGNKLLNRSGAFWQHESYDHVVRNDKELRRIVNYIIMNPMKAGLCETAEEWLWSYYNPKFLL